MNDKRKPPIIAIPILVTATALLDLAPCLNRSSTARVSLIPILLELILIACAVFQWVYYLRAYVDFRIDQLRQEQQSIVSPPPAPAPTNDRESVELVTDVPAGPR